jgi:hypothetical protein
MNDHRLVAILALLLPTLAQAASVATPIVACKAEADSKKVFECISKNNTAGLDEFKTSKITTGDCSSLRRASPSQSTRRTANFCAFAHRRARLYLDRQRYDK